MNLTWFCIGFILGTLIYVSILCGRIYSYKDYSPTEEDIKRECKLMELEKEHFGHIAMFHERQTKEYKKWLKGLK
jgi:hypothetical protein